MIFIDKHTAGEGRLPVFYKSHTQGETGRQLIVVFKIGRCFSFKGSVVVRLVVVPAGNSCNHIETVRIFDFFVKRCPEGVYVENKNNFGINAKAGKCFVNFVQQFYIEVGNPLVDTAFAFTMIVCGIR